MLSGNAVGSFDGEAFAKTQYNNVAYNITAPTNSDKKPIGYYAESTCATLVMDVFGNFLPSTSFVDENQYWNTYNSVYLYAAWGTVQNVSTSEEFKTALTSEDNYYINLDQSVEIDETVTVLGNKVIDSVSGVSIFNRGVLNIGADSTVTIGKSLINSGTLTIEGMVIEDLFMSNSGTINLTGNGVLFLSTMHNATLINDFGFTFTTSATAKTYGIMVDSVFVTDSAELIAVLGQDYGRQKNIYFKNDITLEGDAISKGVNVLLSEAESTYSLNTGANEIYIRPASYDTGIFDVRGISLYVASGGLVSVEGDSLLEAGININNTVTIQWELFYVSEGAYVSTAAPGEMRINEYGRVTLSSSMYSTYVIDGFAGLLIIGTDIDGNMTLTNNGTLDVMYGTYIMKKGLKVSNPVSTPVLYEECYVGTDYEGTLLSFTGTSGRAIIFPDRTELFGDIRICKEFEIKSAVNIDSGIVTFVEKDIYSDYVFYDYGSGSLAMDNVLWYSISGSTGAGEKLISVQTQMTNAIGVTDYIYSTTSDANGYYKIYVPAGSFVTKIGAFADGKSGVSLIGSTLDSPWAFVDVTVSSDVTTRSLVVGVNEGESATFSPFVASVDSQSATYTFTIPVDTFGLLTFSKTGYADTEFEVISTIEDETISGITVSTHNISGTVTGISGEGSVTVILEVPGEGSTNRRYCETVNGNYSFTGLAFGDYYNVMIEEIGYAYVGGAVYSGTMYNVDIRHDIALTSTTTKEITGKVLMPDGITGIPNMAVICKGDFVYGETVTDASGSYTFTVNTCEDYVTIYVPLYNGSNNCSVNVQNENEGNITYRDYIRVDVFVEKYSERTELQSIDISVDDGISSDVIHFPGNHGTMFLFPGDNTISAIEDGYTSADYTVNDQDSVLNLFLESSQDCVVSGYVQCGILPVEGATVSCGLITAMTDSYGYYQILVEPGYKTISVQKDGYLPISMAISVTEDITQSFSIMEDASTPNRVNTFEEFKGALTNDTITIVGSFDISESIEIGTGKLIIINTGVTVNISTGSVLTNNGTINNSGIIREFDTLCLNTRSLHGVR